MLLPVVALLLLPGPAAAAQERVPQFLELATADLAAPGWSPPPDKIKSSRVAFAIQAVPASAVFGAYD